MNLQGFHHLAIQVKALEDVAGFYREVLGLREIERHHGDDGRLQSIWLDVGGGGFLALERVESPPSPDPAFRDGRPGLFWWRCAFPGRTAPGSAPSWSGGASRWSTRRAGRCTCATRKGTGWRSATTRTGEPPQPPLVGFSSPS